ncbi:MAG: hypothetical protein ACLSU6_05025 [Thomasclavelia ramosa]
MKKFIKEKLNYLFEEYNYSLYQRDSELNKLNFISETLIQLLSFGVVLLASFHYKKEVLVLVILSFSICWYRI